MNFVLENGFVFIILYGNSGCDFNQAQGVTKWPLRSFICKSVEVKHHHDMYQYFFVTKNHIRVYN